MYPLHSLGGMSRWAVVVVGCSCALLSACAAPTQGVAEVRASPRASLPRPAPAWNEDFAAHTELEEVRCSGTTLLLPVGLRLPEHARISAATEASVVMADDDPRPLRKAIAASAAAAGYHVRQQRGDVTVWVGKGMAIRLQARINAQVLAWGPEKMADTFAGSR